MFNQSMSGDRGSARLKSDASGIQMDEFGIGGQVKKFDGLRQQQHRWRRKQHRVGQSHDGADRADVVRMPVGIVIGRRLLLTRLTDRIRRKKAPA